MTLYLHHCSNLANLFFDSIVVSIPPCHGGDRGSIPRQRMELKFCHFFARTELKFCHFFARDIEARYYEGPAQHSTRLLFNVLPGLVHSFFFPHIYLIVAPVVPARKKIFPIFRFPGFCRKIFFSIFFFLEIQEISKISVQQ